MQRCGEFLGLLKNLGVLCQGGWEADETIEAAALRETIEEAGVLGDIEVSLPAFSLYIP